jgi:hypothetical protein
MHQQENVQNSRLGTHQKKIKKSVDTKFKTSFWLFQCVNTPFYLWNQLSLQFLNNHNSCSKIWNQILAAGIQKIPDLLTNEEWIKSISILIETWIRSNHYVNHNFFIWKWALILLVRDHVLIKVYAAEYRSEEKFSSR